MNYGIWSLVPILVVLILIFISKNSLLSIIVGLLVESIIIYVGEGESLSGINSLMTVFQDASTVEMIFFVMIIGALIGAMNSSGGLQGITNWLQKKKSSTNSKVLSQLFIMLIGILMFVDATSSIATTSIVGRPLFDENNISRKKLALIANSTASPIAWIVPIGGAGMLTAGAVSQVIGSENAFSMVVKAVPYQFYTFSLLILLFISVIFKFDIGKKIKIQEENTQIIEQEKSYKNPRAINMILPLCVLVGTIITLLIVTGKGDITKGNGATSVFVSGLITLALCLLLYVCQRIATVNQCIGWFIGGMKDMLEVTILLMVAFAFSIMISKLGAASFLLSLTNGVNISFLPMIAVIVSAIIAFCTGTSGGTVVLMISLLLPMAGDNTAIMPLIIGAIISGSVFGDQCSLISDSVIMTSSMVGVKPLDHVLTQLPYALIALGFSIVLYLIIGLVM